MNLSTATPREIDEKIAELEGKMWGHRAVASSCLENLHDAAGDRKTYTSRTRSHWGMTNKDAIAKVRELLANTDPAIIKFKGYHNEQVLALLVKHDVAEEAADRLGEEIDVLEDEWRRRPWSRFFKLCSTKDSHIHDTRWCQGLHRSDQSDLGWRPDLSGKSDEEAVAELGPVMCSKCFPDAPVENRRDPKDLRVDPNACPGGGQRPVKDSAKRVRSYTGVNYYAQCTECTDRPKVRQDGMLAQHKRKTVVPNEITAPGPDGKPSDKPLKVDGDTVKTVRTAESKYGDEAAYVEAVDAGWYPYPGRLDKARAAALQILEALAAKNGKTVDEERKRLAPKVAKKAKIYKQ